MGTTARGRSSESAAGSHAGIAASAGRGGWGRWHARARPAARSGLTSNDEQGPTASVGGVRAIVVEHTGGPDVLGMQEVSTPEPGPGQAAVRVSYAGVNFVDTYHRTGLYPLDVPFTPGREGSGEVTAVGDGVAPDLLGSRVAWADAIGSYAEVVVAPVDRLVPLPDEVPHDIGAAVLLQGLTAHYLANDAHPLQQGERCLIHAGAGGVGRLLIQMAKAKGAEVLATVGGADKVAVASSAGADHVIDYGEVDFGQAVEAITGERSVDVVYDGVGASTFERGLDLLRPRGLMVAFGNASGPAPPLDVLRLARAGSLYVTRPILDHYIPDRAALLRRAAAVFDAIAAGDLGVLIGARLRWDAASTAHRLLEGRETTGKVLLEVSDREP